MGIQIILLSIILISCSPHLIPTSIPTSSETDLQKQNSIIETSTPPVTLELHPANTTIFVTGITDDNDLRFSLGDGTPFWILYEIEENYKALRFMVALQKSPYHKITPAQLSSLTMGWHILIYCYRTDETYTNQPFLIIENLKVEGTVGNVNLNGDVQREDLKIKFGDCRAFTFQLADKQKNIQQGNFVLNPNTGLYDNKEVRESVNAGVFIGYPYSLHENETAFFQQDNFTTIFEPQGGFYRLCYMFNFGFAVGNSSLYELEKIASEISIKLFHYKENGVYSNENYYQILGETQPTWPYILDLPMDYLKENKNGNNMYYLQFVDSNGKIIKEEYFTFIPYPPNE